MTLTKLSALIDSSARAMGARISAGRGSAFVFGAPGSGPPPGTLGGDSTPALAGGEIAGDAAGEPLERGSDADGSAGWLSLPPLAVGLPSGPPAGLAAAEASGSAGPLDAGDRVAAAEAAADTRALPAGLASAAGDPVAAPVAGVRDALTIGEAGTDATGATVGDVVATDDGEADCDAALSVAGDGDAADGEDAALDDGKTVEPVDANGLATGDRMALATGLGTGLATGDAVAVAASDGEAGDVVAGDAGAAGETLADAGGVGVGTAVGTTMNVLTNVWLPASPCRTVSVVAVSGGGRYPAGGDVSMNVQVVSSGAWIAITPSVPVVASKLCMPPDDEGRR